MSDQPVARIAFVGCGGFTTASIFPTIPLIPRISVVAVCDLDRERAERASRRFNACPVFTDMDEMFDNIEVDGVFAIGPADTQYKVAPRILARGIPVYVEKPSAVTSAQAREMLEVARENNTWGQVGYMKRFCHSYKMAKKIIARPEFGEINMVNCKFSQGSYPRIWGIDYAARAFLIGQLTHIFDLIRHFGGDVASVQAICREPAENPADPTESTRIGYLANIIYRSGAIGQVNVNGMEARPSFRDFDERLEVVGLENIVTVQNMNRLTWRRGEDFVEDMPEAGIFKLEHVPAGLGGLPSPTHLGYTGEVQHFALRCIGEVDKGVSGDLEDSMKSLQIGEAIYESAMSGGVKVDIAPED